MSTPPTGVSGQSGYIPDVMTLIQEACERASVDFTGAYTLRSAKRSLDILTMSWANKGLNLWTIDEQHTPLVAGQDSYNLPSDTVDLIYPVLRTTQNGIQQDLVIAREDFVDYASIPNKTRRGRPTVIYVSRQVSQPVAHVWLVPDSANYTLVWWRLRRMQNSGAATNSMDIPFRFIPAMTSGLAWQLALKKPMKDLNLISYLKSVYEQDLLDAQREDRDRSSIYLSVL